MLRPSSLLIVPSVSRILRLETHAGGPTMPIGRPPPPLPAPGPGSREMNVLSPSSIGAKIIVAITGLLLVAFVLGHMAGNLLIFLGRDWLNAYAHHLKSLGTLLWILRGGLLLVFIIHVIVALQLAAH